MCWEKWIFPSAFVKTMARQEKIYFSHRIQSEGKLGGWRDEKLPTRTISGKENVMYSHAPPGQGTLSPIMGLNLKKNTPAGNAAWSIAWIGHHLHPSGKLKRRWYSFWKQEPLRVVIKTALQNNYNAHRKDASQPDMAELEPPPSKRTMLAYRKSAGQIGIANNQAQQHFSTCGKWIVAVLFKFS